MEIEIRMSEWITQHHRAQLAQMQDALLSTLSRTLRGAASCALIDFPDHANVGDSMIWLGELEALRRLGIRIKYVCTDQSYDPDALRRCLDDQTAILIHGGGNFGTLYVRHQQLRESVLEDFPQQRTIQLSQSINFERDEALEKMQRIIGRHRDFHFLVRDARSHDFAALHFDCGLDLCPDFALLMGPQTSDERPRADYFVLARTDKEKGTDWSQALAARPNSTIIQGDWLEADPFEARLSAGTQLARRAAKRLLGRPIENALGLNAVWERAYRAAAQRRIQRGIRMLSQGRIVLTDRLHAHLLCVLLGKPHVVLGDSHGKIRAFYDTYSHHLSPAPWSDGPIQALATEGPLLEAFAA